MRTLKITFLFLFVFSSLIKAQSNLARSISLNIEQQKLSSVLALIE